MSRFLMMAARATALDGSDDDLHALPYQIHRPCDLFFRNQKHVRDVVRHEMPGARPHGDLQSVRYRLRCIVFDDPAFTNGAVNVVRVFGFRGVNLGVRRNVRHGQARA